MTKRNPISAPQNIWFDAKQVDDTDLTLEQQYNDTIQSGIINNHIGTGILPETLEQAILFDSALAAGFLDGVVVLPQNQPADNNFGNQLEISLIGSKVSGSKQVKVAVIGLDFENNLKYETFVFKANEVQIGKRHFTKILVLLFNDFIGDPNYSFNLGGHLTIKEAKPITLSRSAIMVEQSVEPNLFFRDFFVTPPNTLTTLLQSALPLYNIDDLNITISAKDNKALLSGDVTSQIGQKFLATTNNVQKISLLLSVRNTDLGKENDLVWNGDLVVSIYPLQTSINCPTDVAPNLPIDFAPSNIPVAQVSFNYFTLLDAGVQLDSVPQPVDFVFSNSSVAAGTTLNINTYYAVTVKRSGSANKCDILIAVGNNTTPDSRVTSFTGTLWVDIPEEDLWFKVYTDAAKITDGQAYDSGHGIIIPKIIQDPTTLADVDYSLQNIQFSGTDVFRAVVSAVPVEGTPVPDQRTGNPVNSRKENEPQVKLLNTLDLANLEKASDPLVVGAIVDKNKKFFDSLSSAIATKLYSATMVGDELLIKIIDDPTDTGRFDTSVLGLVTNLLNGDLVNAKFYPNTANASKYYRIADAKLCSMILGDVNGDGIIDDADLALLDTYLGYDLNVGLPTNTSVTLIDGSHTSFINGYTTYTKPFTSASALSFQLVDPSTHLVIASGTDGVLTANPLDPRLSQFTSASVNFSVITGISDYKLVITTTSKPENHGGFDISGLDIALNVITLRKVYLTTETIGQLLRADIDGDFYITDYDGYLLQNYISRYPLVYSSGTPYPAPTSNPFIKIGTPFNVIKFKLQSFVDRADDYTATGSGRSTVLHPVQDILLNDGYFATHDFYTNPSLITIEKQLSWEESLVVCNARSKFVPSVFTTQTGYTATDCSLPGIICNVYGSKPDFDGGRVDYFVPDNLIIGNGGEIHRPNGDFYKVDFEVGTIVIEIPDGLYGTEKTINVLEDFIASYIDSNKIPTGITQLGFPAMRFADCTYVTPDALTKDQLRFSVAVQSFSPNTNGLSADGYSGAIVDGKMGVSMDYATGLLTINFTNLYQDPTLLTLSTKVQINVFLKKGGFNNQPLFVDSAKIQNMLELISPFSGAGGSPPALTKLNPLFVYGATGVFSESTGTPTTIGAFVYDTTNTVNTQLKEIVLEVILETTGANAAHIQLYDVTAAAYVNLSSGPSTVLSTLSNVATLVTSLDLKTLLVSGHIYEIVLNTTNIASTAICKMGRLATYYLS